MSTIGIDFGTTKTLVATWDQKRGMPVTLRLGRGKDDLPTTMFVTAQDEVVFGDVADELADHDPTGYVRRIKQKLGRENSFEIIRGQMRPVQDLVQQYLAHVLERVKVEGVHEDIEAAVITTPALAGEPYRTALKNATQMAGIKMVTILEEPLAAGTGYLHLRQGNFLGDQMLVFDWGGGTLDLAVLRVQDGQLDLYPNLVGGDDYLGGEDIDDLILSTLNADTQPSTIKNQLRRRVMDAKRQLATVSSLDLPFDLQDGQHRITITREEFNKRIEDPLDRAMLAVNTFLDRARKNGVSVNTVLLVGGTAQIPVVAETLEARFNLRPVRWDRAIEAVALGAAIHAHETIRNDKVQEKCHKKSSNTPVSPALAMAQTALVSLLQTMANQKQQNQHSQDPKATVNDSLAQALYEEAANALKTGNADTAIQKLTLCVMLSPALAKARELLVSAFAAKNDLQSAMITAKAWADAMPENPRAWVTLGRVAFAGGDFATTSLVLGRIVPSLDAEELLLLAASLYRQGKTQGNVSGVLERIINSETHRTARTLALFLLAWIKRGSDYSEADLQNYNEALAGWRNFTTEGRDSITSMLAYFGISLPNFIRSTQFEMLRALLKLNGNNLRDAFDALYNQCKGEIDFGVVWLSHDPNLFGPILASTLCRKGKIKEATELVTIMCAKNPNFDIRLVQREDAFQDCRNNPRVGWLFEPTLSVTENHGAVFNDITVTNGSPYRVSNVIVSVQVQRQGGKSDVPFTVSFAEIASGTSQIQYRVFKNPTWFGVGVEKVETVVIACDQRFQGSCPHGHGPLKAWKGKPRCCTCGYPY